MLASDQNHLQNVQGIGARRARQIMTDLDRTGRSIDDLFRMNAEDIRDQFKLPIHVARAIVAARPLLNPAHTSAASRDRRQPEKIVLSLTPTDPHYPQRLSTTAAGRKAPTMLQVWGNLDLFNRPSVGFCGSRHVSAKGLQITADAVEQLVAAGCVIISGHADGVDLTAHRTALEAGGATIIVTAEGLSNFKLRPEIRALAKFENLLIVSEFKPQTQWTEAHALTRNSTIIGLSDALVLIESRREGGTFDAGKKALRLKIPVFVPQYQTTTEGNEGNVYFLEHGAFAFGKNPATGRANITTLKTAVLNSAPSDPE